MKTKKNSDFKIGEVVVYPKHGVGQITETKKVNIGGIDVETYILKFEKDKAVGLLPINKQSHLSYHLVHLVLEKKIECANEQLKLVLH